MALDRANRSRFVLSPALLVLAIVVRLIALSDPPPIDIDEARYLVAAHHLRTGVGYSDWRGPETHIHPLHPWLTSIQGDGIKTLERRGRLVTFFASVLLLLPLAVLARRLQGEECASILLLLAATHPGLVGAAATPQPESLYVLLVASALCLIWPDPEDALSAWRFGAAGLLFGLSYLARPEGLLVGLLAGGIALHQTRGRGTRTLADAALLLSGILLAASPYLLFLRCATGAWVITGKVTELFFVGQAMYDAGGAPPSLSSYLDLIAEWKAILPYVVAHPGIVLLRVGRNILRIAGWIVPRALGPAGIVGAIACTSLQLPRGELRGRLLLVGSPCLTLGLMLLTFENRRVIGSVLPFLLVLASSGLAALADRPLLRRRIPRAPAAGVLLLLVTVCWAPTFVRARARPSASNRELERQAAQLALQRAGEPGAVASNNPVLSFYAGDPRLFGPPRRYEPLPWDASCSDLAAILRERGARVAVLDRGDLARFAETEAEHCPLDLAFRLTDPEGERVISILVLRQ